MNQDRLVDGLIMFVAFVAFTTLHEFAHAWVAGKCGDDTPRKQGRLTLDPLAHIELIGTIILPLVVVLMSAANGHAAICGWGRPVQVNLDNFRKRQRDDILVSAAGPAMNFLTAILILGLTKVVDLAHYRPGVEMGFDLASLSLFLCFFNLLPIPPLDGAHVLRNLVGMSDETYAAMSRFSFMFMIIIFRVPAISQFVNFYTNCVLVILAWPFGWRLSF